MAEVITSNKAMKADDRCDRCGAQAYMEVVLASGLGLLFCAHHAREHEAKLRETENVIIADHTDHLKVLEPGHPTPAAK